MKLILIILLLSANQCLAKELIFQCEDEFSYKVSKYNNAYYKKSGEDWKKLNNFNISKNKIEFLIPNLSYLECKGKELPVCNYSKVISGFLNSESIKVSEVVQNDCYVGLMGCNFYRKGLSFNIRTCKYLKK